MCVAVPNKLSTVICLVVDPSIIGKTAVADVILDEDADGNCDILIVDDVGIRAIYYVVSTINITGL